MLLFIVLLDLLYYFVFFVFFCFLILFLHIIAMFHVALFVLGCIGMR